jgi:hypothetical protein
MREEAVMGRKTLFMFVILVSAAGVSLADEFRLGGIGGIELVNSFHRNDLQKEFDNEIVVYPGLYWEYLPGNLGIGMTYLLKFNRQASSLQDIDYTWYFDWIGTLDARYHFLSESFLDPFIEAGIGNAGRVDMTSYGPQSEGERDELLMSLFGQMGGGVAFHFKEMHLGVKMLYRFLNRPVPAARFDTYPLKNFHVSFFGGVTF